MAAAERLTAAARKSLELELAAAREGTLAKTGQLAALQVRCCRLRPPALPSCHAALQSPVAMPLTGHVSARFSRTSTPSAARCLQLESLWTIPTAAVS